MTLLANLIGITGCAFIAAVCLGFLEAALPLAGALSFLGLTGILSVLVKVTLKGNR